MNIEDIKYKWSFWWDSDLAAHLISLVISWEKSATTGLFLSNETIWEIGEYAIIYDEKTWKDLCIIEYTNVEIKAFLEVDFAYVIKEWERDENIESWRESHRKFYTEEYPWRFDDFSFVVCEEFKLLKLL